MGKLRVLLFASARQAAGSAETSLAFDEDRIDEEIFWARLLEKFPSLAPLRGSVRIATVSNPGKRAVQTGFCLVDGSYAGEPLDAGVGCDRDQPLEQRAKGGLLAVAQRPVLGGNRIVRSRFDRVVADREHGIRARRPRLDGGSAQQQPEQRRP